MTQTPEAPKTRRVSPTRILLVASLALNLLVVGLVAGAILRHGRDDPPPLRDLGYGPFGEALSKTDKMALARGMVGRAGDLRANREDLSRQFDGMLAALRADPFDPVALEELVDQQRTKLAERQEIGQRLLLDRVGAMSPEERRAFADRLERNLRHGGRDRRH